MRKQTAIVTATAMLLCGAANANAATAMHGSDTVMLSAAQQKALWSVSRSASTVWNDLTKQATNQNASGFEAQTGRFVPNSVKIAPMPSKVTVNIPSFGRYDYAIVDHHLVIVDPTNKVIVDVLKG